MTLKQSRNLAVRQVGKVNPRSLNLLFNQKRVNSKLVKNIFLNSVDKTVLNMLINHFVDNAKSGDVKLKLFLNRLVLKKFNPNSVSRWRVLNKFYNLAQEGDSFGLRGLLIGVKDSVLENRGCALKGLRYLAETGDVRVLDGLVFGLKDSNKYNRNVALDGLRLLAVKGDVRVLDGLVFGLKDSDSVNRGLAFGGLQELAEIGNLRAKKFLEEYKRK